MRARWILAASTTVVGETTTLRVTRLGRGEGACSQEAVAEAVEACTDDTMRVGRPVAGSGPTVFTFR